MPLLGRTQILTRIVSHSLAGWCAREGVPNPNVALFDGLSL